MERLRAWLQRYWLILLVIIAVLVFALLNRRQIAGILSTLVRGNFFWIGAAILLQVVFYLLYAELYHLGFGSVGVASRTIELIPVLFAARVVQVVIPTGGASALAVFVADAARRRQSGTRAAEGVLLVLLTTLIVLVPFLALGLAYLLIATGTLESYQIIGAVALLIYTAVLAAVVFLGRYIPRLLRFLFGLIQGIASWGARRLRRQPLPEDWGDRQAAAYVAASESITAHPRQLRTVLLVAVALQTVDIASLYAVALAYNALPSVGAVITAYTLNVAYAVATPVPLGLGVSAGVIALVLASTGTSPNAAGATAVVYRGLNAWLPILVGIFFLTRVRGLRGGDQS